LRGQGVPQGTADQVAGLPPVSTLFATFLGNNPISHLLAPSGALRSLPAHNVAVLTGKRFFPELVSGPFHHGLATVFGAATAIALIAALASVLRGRHETTGPGGPTAGPGTTGGAANPPDSGKGNTAWPKPPSS
jgi:hypothetical protein